MDDFTVYGNTFEEALENLEKVLKRCKETNLSLSHEKCFIMFAIDKTIGNVEPQKYLSSTYFPRPFLFHLPTSVPHKLSKIVTY